MGRLQDRADQLVRATVLSDLGVSVNGGHGRHGRRHSGCRGGCQQGAVRAGRDGDRCGGRCPEKIETSLHKAAQALADRGVDAKTIDATIDRFRSQLANALDGMAQGAERVARRAQASAVCPARAVRRARVLAACRAAAALVRRARRALARARQRLSVTSVSKFVAREVRKERGTIDLVTAEGDRVSIRFRTKEVVAGSVTQSTASDGTTTTAAKASVFSRGGMKIEVDGDLNEDELKAIGDLLGKVDDIANKFFSGDVQTAFSAAGSLGVDSDQIAAYRLNLTYSRKVTAAYGYAGASLPAQASGSSSAASTSGSAADMTSTASGAAAGSAGGASSGASDGTAGSTTDASSGTSAELGNRSLLWHLGQFRNWRLLWRLLWHPQPVRQPMPPLAPRPARQPTAPLMRRRVRQPTAPLMRRRVRQPTARQHRAQSTALALRRSAHRPPRLRKPSSTSSATRSRSSAPRAAPAASPSPCIGR